MASPAARRRAISRTILARSSSTTHVTTILRPFGDRSTVRRHPYGGPPPDHSCAPRLRACHRYIRSLICSDSLTASVALSR
ncbi:hypothetical protein BCD48_05145 [Pseudofrankia sp. BMG5.36]|nr:hypothetical protein BCD48_05145 [Pseudofrankia sp. BMG5.36]